MTGTPDPRSIAAVIRTVLQVDQKHRGMVAQDEAEKARHTPWMPFQPFTFIALAAEAVAEVEFPPAPADRPRFLEIGAGPGTKMLLMRELFGFDVLGFDRINEYAATGRALGLDVITADALDWPHYGGNALIWFNRVFRDPAAQRELEYLVWAAADPGTVIMCANLEGRPPAPWYPVLDSWGAERRGIWQKPFSQPSG